MRITTLIVDDEAPGRAVLRNYIAAHPELELIGEAENGAEAVHLIEEFKPQLVFLDVQMPDLDGFGVIEEISARHMPATIFVTAYDRYALKAFEAHAVDYLLKPFDKVRFERALRHACDLITSQEHARREEQLLALLESARTVHPESARFTIRSGDRTTLISLDEIDWVEANANYVIIHVGTQAYQLRESISRMAERLDPNRFVRVHRSVIVNFKKIRELQSCNSGEYMVVLKNGKELPCSRGYRAALDSLFSQAPPL
jgi:two-component system, LytTR family, response regulator